jgi:phosphopantothenoylcysteine decarboxylase/phosphopantothenate--cysteine ligase
MRIVLGVSAGIAAYKAALVLRLLTEAGHDVQVIPTPASLEFVGRATWDALSGRPAHTSVFDDVPGVEHVRAGATADLVIVAPATADLLAKAATGQADDLLTATLLVATCPVLYVPAMHTQMWRHPATQANVATLRDRGQHVLEPAIGRLTGPDSGPGRLPEPEDIVAAALALVAETGQDLAGCNVVISAGGTREPLDPVRFIGNRSSGRQGYALAEAAQARGAQVTLVAANVTLPTPAGVKLISVESTADLREVMHAEADGADVVVMAAAVADFRPGQQSEHKVKKTEGQVGWTVELITNPDILAELVAARRPGQLIIGFGAETGDGSADVQAHGRAKAIRKGADLLVVNPVSGTEGFGDVPNDVTVYDAAGEVVGSAAGTKLAVAEAIWDLVIPRL